MSRIALMIKEWVKAFRAGRPIKKAEQFGSAFGEGWLRFPSVLGRSVLFRFLATNAVQHI